MGSCLVVRFLGRSDGVCWAYIYKGVFVVILARASRILIAVVGAMGSVSCGLIPFTALREAGQDALPWKATSSFAYQESDRTRLCETV